MNLFNTVELFLRNLGTQKTFPSAGLKKMFEIQCGKIFDRQNIQFLGRADRLVNIDSILTAAFTLCSVGSSVIDGIPTVAGGRFQRQSPSENHLLTFAVVLCGIQ